MMCYGVVCINTERQLLGLALDLGPALAHLGIQIFFKVFILIEGRKIMKQNNNKKKNNNIYHTFVKAPVK